MKFYMQTEVSELREQEGKVNGGQRLPGGTALTSPRAAIPFPSGVLFSPLSYPLKFVFLDLAPRSKCVPVWCVGWLHCPHSPPAAFLRNYGQFLHFTKEVSQLGFLPLQRGFVPKITLTCPSPPVSPAAEGGCAEEWEGPAC